MDINIAKDYRDKNNCTLVAVRDGEVIYSSSDIGVLPLYLAYRDEIDLADASIADKVVGKGAAMIMKILDIKAMHTYIISESAYTYLHDNDIVVSYDEMVEYIANRDNDGQCPVEAMAQESESTDELLYKVEQFLKRLELI